VFQTYKYWRSNRRSRRAFNGIEVQILAWQYLYLSSISPLSLSLSLTGVAGGLECGVPDKKKGAGVGGAGVRCV
jgi:hypothetical protein